MKFLPISTRGYSRCLSRSVQDIASSNFSFVHLIVNHLKLRKTDNLEGSMDQATAVEFDGLGAVLAVTHVRTLYPDHLDDRLEDWCLKVSTGGETNADDCAARADVFSSLLEGLLVNSDEDDGMRTKTVWRSLLHVGHHVLGGGKVDEYLCSELLRAHLLLLGTGIDGNGAKTHDFGVLASKGAETTPCTNNCDPLAGLSTRLL
jgi:hypothetical protein